MECLHLGIMTTICFRVQQIESQSRVPIRSKSLDRKAIGEIYRVLKPGCQAILAVPNYGDVTYEDKSLDYAGRAAQYGTGDHVRMNGLDFADKLRVAGFEVKIVSVDEVEGNFVDRSVQTPHTDSDRYLFHCTKYPLRSQRRGAGLAPSAGLSAT